MRRAFTMLEAMVTLAIMAIVASAAVGSFAAFSRLAKQAERDVVLVETIRTGLLYLLTEVRQAGGVGVQPWASVFVEDDCQAARGFPACRGSDRLTLVQGIPTYPSCVVVEDFGSQVAFEKVGGSCCFHEDGFVRQAALIFPRGTGLGAPVDETLQPVVLRGIGDKCKFDVIPIIAGEALPRPLSQNKSFTKNGRKGAVAVLADIKTFYVDWGNDDTGALTMQAELNGDGNVSGERLTLLERVADFQASIGYAVDGRPYLESASGDGDAWWPGAPEEAGNAAAADGSLRPERAVFVGVSTIGVTSGGQKTVHVSTPWGPPRSFTNLRAFVGTERLGLQPE